MRVVAVTLLAAVLSFVISGRWMSCDKAASPEEPPPMAEHVRAIEQRLAVLEQQLAKRPDNPWSLSLVIRPDGTYSYYVRDTEGELGKALVGDVLKDAAALHANTIK